MKNAKAIWFTSYPQSEQFGCSPYYQIIIHRKSINVARPSTESTPSIQLSIGVEEQQPDYYWHLISFPRNLASLILQVNMTLNRCPWVVQWVLHLPSLPMVKEEEEEEEVALLAEEDGEEEDQGQ